MLRWTVLSVAFALALACGQSAQNDAGELPPVSAAPDAMIEVEAEETNAP